MTTIAFDGRIAAADSKTICGDRKSRCLSPKLQLRDGVVYATTGWYGFLDAWIEWLQKGADPKDRPVHGNSSNDIGAFIVIKNGECFTYSHLIPYPVKERLPIAFGSGSDYAMGAMLAGANAEEAVDIACQLDNGSGGPAQVIDLSELQKEIAA